MDVESNLQEQLFAKLSGKRGKHLLVFSDQRQMNESALRAFAPPTIHAAIAFAPGRSLHDDEWFVVSLDDDQIKEMITPYTAHAANNVNITTIRVDDYSKVVALYKTEGTTLLLTKITPGLKVEQKTFIGLNETPVLKSYEKAIEFTGRVDAFYDGAGKLYFREYSKISALFEGIEVFYRNATAAEKETFLAQSFFDVQNIDVDAIGMRDSGKIAAILDDRRVQLDDAGFQGKVLAYAKEFKPEAVADDGQRLRMQDRASFQASLNILSERYYRSELFGDKREALDSAKLDG